MKNLILFLSAVTLVLSACSTGKTGTESSALKTDSVVKTDTLSTTKLTGLMKMNPEYKIDDSLIMIFTIYNRASNVQQFCKWHTPFEPPMSKYLDIRDETGSDVNYQGAMAKRVMPPPANSYLKIKALDSLSSSVDLRKSYQITKPGKYTVIYNAEGISGVSVPDSISFVIKK
ncbi:MAG: protease [Bacteroidota bacterium]